MNTKDDLFISLSDDLLFKETFSHPSNRKFLIYFLSCFTDFSFDFLSNVDINVKYESIFTKTKIDDKSYRGDVIITFSNYIINLECYSRFNEASFNKSSSYVMRIFSTQLDVGNNNYDILESIIQLNFVDNVSKEFPNKLNFNYGIVNLEDIEDKRLADKFVMKYFRLDKARCTPYNKSDKTLLWLKFIGAKSAKEREEIAKGDEMLMELNDWIDKYIKDEHTKEVYGKWAEKIEKDKLIEQGIEQGENNKTLEIAKNLLKRNFDLKEIREITNLPLKDLRKLQKEI